MIKKKTSALLQTWLWQICGSYIHAAQLAGAVDYILRISTE